MQFSTYHEAAKYINSGDLVAFRVSKYSPKISHFFKYFTGNDVYHIGFAVWLYSEENDKRLFIVQASHGNRQIVPLKLYENEKIDVYEAPVPFAKISAELLAPVGSVEYAYFDLISIWLKERFGFKMPNHKGEVCSEMVGNILETGGFDCWPDDLVSPEVIVEELEAKNIKLKIQIRNE